MNQYLTHPIILIAVAAIILCLFGIAYMIGYDRGFWDSLPRRVNHRFGSHKKQLRRLAEALDMESVEGEDPTEVLAILIMEAFSEGGE